LAASRNEDPAPKTDSHPPSLHFIPDTRSIRRWPEQSGVACHPPLI